jgi:hypothetical protein
MDEERKYVFLRNWMSILRSDISATKLKELVIPGSHDSNTVSLNKWHPGYPFAACQSLGIYEQLERGIRMFDLRYGPGNSKLPVVDQHGPIKGGDFLITFRDIRRFLEKYPDEFIIVNMQNIEQLPSKSLEFLIDNILSLLGNYLVTQNDMDEWFDMETVTMGDIFSRQKRILLFSWSSLWEGTKHSAEDCRAMGIHLQSDCIVSRWHNTDKVDVMFQNNIADLQDWNIRNLHAKKLFAIQIVLTIQGGWKNVMKYFCSLNFPTIYKLASKVIRNNNLLKFLSQALSLGANLIILDYIEIELSAIEMIIMYNVSHVIDVKACYIGTKNCTRLFHSGLLESRMLLVTNLKSIIESTKTRNKEIIVIYSFNNGPLKISIISKKSKKVLIYKNPLDEDSSESPGNNVMVLFKSNKYILEKLNPEDEEAFEKSSRWTNTKKGQPFLMIRNNVMTIISESAYASMMLDQSAEKILVDK